MGNYEDIEILNAEVERGVAEALSKYYEEKRRNISLEADLDYQEIRNMNNTGGYEDIEEFKQRIRNELIEAQIRLGRRDPNNWS